MSPEERKERIEESNRRMMTSMYEAADLIMHCPHEKVSDRKGRALCFACGKNIGRYCAVSPVGYCELDKETEKCIYCDKAEEKIIPPKHKRGKEDG
ncbi:MAG: hypothetical protein GY861_17125 [bacterium]|nr:hypothetical protein [bacterium]